MDRRKVITMRKPAMEKAKHVHLGRREKQRKEIASVQDEVEIYQEVRGEK